jgi:hypothetical protein
MKSSLVIACAAALAGALGAGAAQARDADVQWSVTIGSPGYGHYPAPVVVAPPVYRAPQPVVVVPQPIRHHAPTYWDRDGDGIPNRHDRFYNPPWDRDGDGIPNRRDRYHNPPWDRDGDGIPNRHDRYDHAPRWDRDRDGVPNRYDRYDDNPWRR